MKANVVRKRAEAAQSYRPRPLLELSPKPSTAGAHWLRAVPQPSFRRMVAQARPHRSDTAHAAGDAFKRIFDVVFTLLALVIALPLGFLIGLALLIDSRGPILYGHKRLGRNGKYFRAWKFRTMVPNADEVLAQYLRRHPELRREWDRDCKLRKDPRVTTVGKFLRRTSLDELPQLINVLVGEMSLVGPRPIVDEEVRRYSIRFDHYTRVRPGLAGLWQVSGRNNLSYRARVHLDSYYVRRRCFAMDLAILARIPLVVVKGDGAY